MTEFEIIERYFSRATNDADVLIGVGDDAALLRVDEPLAVSVDTLVEGVHFLRDTPPDALGHRVLAVNLSDLAAMGAKPRWCTLALTLPGIDPNWLDGFAQGFFALAKQHGVSLVGGNLAQGPLAATVQIMGTLPQGLALTRAGGKPGHDIYVTGTLGDGAAGLRLLREGRADLGASEAWLAERFLRPSPRVAMGLALRGVASAAIDVSDGLVGDLGHLCRASACGAIIEIENLPLSTALLGTCGAETALDCALAGGDDYELCFCAPTTAAERVAANAEAVGVPVTRVGRLVAGDTIDWQRGGTAYVPAMAAYSHFAPTPDLKTGVKSQD